MRAPGHEQQAWIAQVKIPTRRLSLSLRQFSQMLRAGIHLIAALEVLTQQSESPELAEIWWTVQAAVSQGSTLSKALSPFKRTFTPSIIQQIRVAENSGSLVALLARLADSLERQDLLYRRVIAALAYPCVVLLVSVIISLALLHYVLPPFLNSLLSMKLNLPWPTLLLLAITRLLGYLWLLLPVAAILIWQKDRLLNLIDYRHQLFQICAYVPWLRRCLCQHATIHLSSTAAQLISVGSNTLKCWELALQASSDPRLQALWPNLRSHLTQGEDPSTFFSQYHHLVSPLFCAVLEVGEQTGKTSTLLERISCSLEDDLDHQLNLLASLLQPVLLMLVSISSLFVILALFLPLYSQLMNL